MDSLFSAFHDELEKISEERSKLPAALAVGALGTGGVIAHARHKKVLADRARLARKSKILAAAPLTALVAGAGIDAILRSRDDRRMRAALRAFAESQAKKSRQRSGKMSDAELFRHPVAAAPTKATNRKPYYVDEQIRRGRAYEKNKKQEAAKAARRRQRSMASKT